MEKIGYLVNLLYMTKLFTYDVHKLLSVKQHKLISVKKKSCQQKSPQVTNYMIYYHVPLVM